MPRLPAGFTKVERRNQDGSKRTYIATRFYKFDTTGRRKRVTIYGMTLEAAKQRRQKEEKRRIAAFDANKQTLSEYLARWLERFNVSKAWAPRTLELYTLLVKKHIGPYLGMLAIGKICKEHVSGFLDTIKSSRTRQQVYLILHAALSAAVEDDLIPSNPVGKMPRHVYKQFRSLNKDEAQRLLKTAKGGNYFVLFYLALTTGMRQGELFGLRWEHVDFEHRFLSICGTLTRDKGLTLLRPPKGKRPRRVDLSEHDIELLRAYRKHQLASRASEWLFTDTEGNPLQRHNFAHRVWRPLLKDAKVGPLRFHDLRHTSATLSLAEGIPVKIVQERLGHASAKMTLDVYAKVVPSLQQEAAAQMSGIFGDWHTSWYTSVDPNEQNVVK
jgi:integrase